MEAIGTDQAPAAIGPYSQAVRSGNTVYLSGQIPLDPETQAIESNDIEQQINQVFKNLQAVAVAAGGDLDKVVKVTVYLTNLGHFGEVNAVMEHYFSQPYPARAAVEVAGLPRGALVEADAIMVV